MNTKTAIIILIVAVVVLFGYFAANQIASPQPAGEKLEPGVIRAPDGSLFREPATGPPTTPSGSYIFNGEQVTDLIYDEPMSASPSTSTVE